MANPVLPMPLLMRCGAKFIVWITLPIAPDFTNWLAISVPLFSNLSLYMIENIFFVSFCTFLTAASCSKVIIPGLSVK